MSLLGCESLHDSRKGCTGITLRMTFSGVMVQRSYVGGVLQYTDTYTFEETVREVRFEREAFDKHGEATYPTAGKFWLQTTCCGWRCRFVFLYRRLDGLVTDVLSSYPDDGFLFPYHLNHNAPGEIPPETDVDSEAEAVANVRAEPVSGWDGTMYAQSESAPGRKGMPLRFAGSSPFNLSEVDADWVFTDSDGREESGSGYAGALTLQGPLGGSEVGVPSTGACGDTPSAWGEMVYNANLVPVGDDRMEIELTDWRLKVEAVADED